MPSIHNPRRTILSIGERAELSRLRAENASLQLAVETFRGIARDAELELQTVKAERDALRAGQG